MARPKNFDWKSGSGLPRIEQHSIKKLDIIGAYLEAYIATLTSNPAIPQLKLTIIDTFSGGGLYRSRSGEDVAGSPVRIIDAVITAEYQAQIQRSKPFQLDAEFHFSDSSQDHVNHLGQVLRKRYPADQPNMRWQCRVESSAAALRRLMPQLQQRRGRHIFVLDQFGYKDVRMEDLNFIFNSLPNAEVIMTFGVDALLNHLTDKKPITDTLRNLGIDEKFVQDWLAIDPSTADRWRLQHKLREALAIRSGASFLTPFYFRSITDNRWMMLMHLSRHQRARDRMLILHWDHTTEFRNWGESGLYSLTYNPDPDDAPAMFDFNEIGRLEVGNQLANHLPAEVWGLLKDGSMTVEQLFNAIGNRTAAPNDTICNSLVEMAVHGELNVLGANGQTRRLSTTPKLTDVIARPQQRLIFPVGSRPKGR